MNSMHEKNIEAYESHRERLEKDHPGQAALMNEGELYHIYPNSGEAYSAGCEKFGLGNFTIINIGEQPISLGILTLNLENQ